MSSIAERSVVVMDFFRQSGATFSACNRYRYRLWRTFDAGKGTVVFIMLNPSTADAERDDPTIRRCIGYARAWGYQRLEIANIFAYRSTDPRALDDAEDPIGPENNAALLSVASTASRIVVAWGNGGQLLERSTAVRALLAERELWCLGTTSKSEPRHPLYVASVQQLERWPQ